MADSRPYPGDGGAAMPHEQDRRQLAALQDGGFRGPEWDRFATTLAGYGFQVMVAWIETGQVFDRLQEKTRHIRLKPPSDGRALSGDVAEELAVETVGRALRAFRTVLEQQGWSASRGASLHTFFIGRCLFRFPAVYRRWLGETRPAPWKEVEILEQLTEADGPYARLLGADPAEFVGHQLDLEEAAQQLNEQLDDRDILRAAQTL